MKTLINIFVLLFLFAGIAEAQNLPFRNYSIEDGLSEAVVNTIAQDEEGYLWIGTGYGLNRFDGINFKSYYIEDGLLNNSVQSLYLDRENRFWIGTDSGVNIIRKDSIHTISNLQPLESSTILSIYQDSQKGMWFTTDGEGVWHWDPQKSLTQYREVHGIGSSRVRAAVEDQKGVMWFATRDGLTKLEDGNFRTFTTRHGLPDNRLRDVILTEDGELWVASRGGLCHFQDEQFNCFSEDDGLMNNRIQSISKDEQENLWLGTEEGVSYFSNGQFKNYSVEQGLGNNMIHATYYDNEGNIWFGTFGGGASIFLGDYVETYTIEEGLPNNVVTSIAEDQRGQFWVSTYGGGISKIGEDIETLTANDGLVDNKVYTLQIDSRDRLFVGTRWGLSIYENDSFKNFDETELPYRKIRAVLPLGGGDEFLLGTYGEGIIEFANGRFIQFTEEDGLANNTVMSLEQTEDGVIWAATYGGVSRIQDTTFTNYTIEDGLPHNGVLDVLEDQNGELWVATFGGIARFDGKGFEAITAADGLPDEVCYFIEQDERGIFWVGTNEGVVRFDYQAYHDGDSERQVFKLITREQGLAANEMNAGASFKDSNDRLWFGSVHGVSVFDPSKEKVTNTPPKVHINSMYVSGEEVPLKPQINMGSDVHNITFSFIGLSFSAPHQMKYQYRLKNSGEGWQETMQRSVSYSALIPGDYTFEVKAQNIDGQWSTNTARVGFTIQAPFWLQWWFLTLVVLVVIGLVIFSYHYYRIKKMMEMERMRVRIASDLHDDVGSALTEIALQSDFLQTMQVSDKLEESLKQIGAQSRKIVSSLDDIVWSIDARNDTVGDLTDRMQDYINNVLPNREVYYHFDGDMQQKLEVSVKENLYLIFKEAVNNIAKHSNADRVEVTLSANGSDETLLKVKDNGTEVKGNRKTGQGLQNMRMRAKRIDAEITFNNKNGFEVLVENGN
ncbi:ligand-binding sensor domain-containing protein [Fodinibius sp. Rm-B-1B1-1]|uniref:ligand-binding sensor domain-containing protein n=1 Tax=Fodinibius alkaliphilus TaxID=3140241 RepID=UPI00315A5989